MGTVRGLRLPGIDQTGNLDDLNAEKSHGRWVTYMNTVAGNEALVLAAAKRFPNAGFFGLNPGFIGSNIRSNLFGGETLLSPQHRTLDDASLRREDIDRSDAYGSSSVSQYK